MGTTLGAAGGKTMPTVKTAVPPSFRSGRKNDVSNFDAGECDGLSYTEGTTR